MRIRQIADRVESLSDKLNDEADRVAAIKEKCDDYLSLVDSISIDFDDDSPRKHSEQKQAEDKLKKLSWDLLSIEMALRDAAWIPDQIFDHLESIVEAPKPKGSKRGR